MILNKIISGGQTGCDSGALFAARDLGLKTGGWIPKGYKISFPNSRVNSNPYLGIYYNLQETESSDYRVRTELNVKDSDATVWVGNLTSPGYRCTLAALKKHKKPYLENPSALDLREFVEVGQIKTLNVAGNRETTYPGIFIYTYLLIMDAFYDVT